MSAIPEICDFNTWKPISTDTLDLRLAPAHQPGASDALLQIVREKTGAQIKYLYTQGSLYEADTLLTVIESCPGLEHISLACAYKVNREVLSAIANLPNLKQLNLDFARFDPGVEVQGLLARSLDPKKIERIDDESVGPILDRCPLTHIDLSGTHITRHTLDKIASCTHLGFVRLNSCWALKKEEIETLRKNCPHIQIVDDSSFSSSKAMETLAKRVTERFLNVEKVPNSSSLRLTLKEGTDPSMRYWIDPHYLYQTTHSRTYEPT